MPGFICYIRGLKDAKNKMKNLIKFCLQRLLGYETYLYVFSLFMIRKLPVDKRERDFLHLLSFLKPDDLVLDIGANIGIMTTHLSWALPNGSVVAFEPVPSNVRVLRRIVKAKQLDNVQIMPVALAEKAGNMEMILPKKGGVKFHGLAHLADTEGEKTGVRVQVPVTTLDTVDFFADKNVAAIKLDVEESEFRVLNGAEALLLRDKPVVYCELWHTKNRALTFRFMNSLGYEAWYLEEGKLSVARVDSAKQNFFFIPDTRK